MCLSGERICVIFQGICITAGRKVKDSTSLLLSEPCGTRLRHIGKGIHALLSGSTGCPASPLCSAFAPLQGSGAPMNPHCLLLISLGELVKVEAQDPCPSPAIPSPCTAQPVFPLRCYRALPALLRALRWEGAGKLSCLDKP